MIVPQFWAEARVQQRSANSTSTAKSKSTSTITVRRFGWSDANEAEAQAHAESRAQEALQRLVAGEKLPRREPKIGYNGAEGVPIREEIIERHGDAVITRNAYGARCLNTPNVFFADVDFNESTPAVLIVSLVAALILIATANAWIEQSWRALLFGVVVALVVCAPVARLLFRGQLALRGGVERVAIARIERFVARNPHWNIRLYRTPAGLRVLATHALLKPDDAQTLACFAALRADPIYVRMCRNQKCFRARVSAKPWRIGIARHMRPRPGVWPVAAERMALRTDWISRYEQVAARYAACRFITEMGSGTTHPDAATVQAIHDELSRTSSALPIA